MTTLAVWPALAISLSVVYFIISILVVVYAVLATISDPSDPTIYQQRLAEARGLSFANANYEYMCEVCSTFVLSNSKHCGACNRCVSGFDHHCAWLNNCVGERNYKLFFKLIIFVFLMTLTHNITNTYTIYLFFTTNEEVGQIHETIFSQILHWEFAWCLIAAYVFNLCAVIFLGHLIVFHIMLQRKEMSTYEYIRWKEDRRNASKIVVKVDNQRDIELSLQKGSDSKAKGKDDIIDLDIAPSADNRLSERDSNSLNSSGRKEPQPQFEKPKKKSCREIIGFFCASKKRSVAQNPCMQTEEQCEDEQRSSREIGGASNQMGSVSPDLTQAALSVSLNDSQKRQKSLRRQNSAEILDSSSKPQINNINQSSSIRDSTRQNPKRQGASASQSDLQSRRAQANSSQQILTQNQKAQDLNAISQDSKKMLAMIRLGTGFDDQNHVTRPRTASQIQHARETLKRVDSQLHTITENAQGEDPLVMSHGVQPMENSLDHQGFGQENFGFPLRNWDKKKLSSGNLFEMSGGPQGSGRGGVQNSNNNYNNTGANGMAIDQSSSLSNYQKLEKTLHKGGTIGRMNSGRGQKQNQKLARQQLNSNNNVASGEIDSRVFTDESVENEQFARATKIQHLQNPYSNNNQPMNSYQQQQQQAAMLLHESSTPGSTNKFTNSHHHHHQHPVVHNYNHQYQHKGPNSNMVSRSQPAWSHAAPLAGDDSTQVVMPEIAESVFSKEEDDDANGYGTSQNNSPDCKPRKFNVSISGTQQVVPGGQLQQNVQTPVLESSEAEPESTLIKEGNQGGLVQLITDNLELDD